MTPNDLDQQLAQALSEGPPDEQVARLAQFWRSRFRQEYRRGRKPLVMGLAVAAGAAAIAVGLVWRDSSEKTGGRELAVQREKESPPVESTAGGLGGDGPSNLVVDRAPADSTDFSASGKLSAGRVPTSMEQALFAARTRGPVADYFRELRSRVEAAVDEASANPQADNAKLAAAHIGPEEIRDAELMLLNAALSSSASRQLAAVRLLGSVGTSWSVGPLLELAVYAELRHDAISSIERIAARSAGRGDDPSAGAAALARCLPSTPNRQVRTAILARLLSAGTDAGLRSYLDAVSGDVYRGEALAAARLAGNELPINALLAMLDDARRATRLSAAIVLGYVDGPRIGAELVTMLRGRRDAPAEAWVALLACRDETASRFLEAAAVEPRLLGHLNNARMFWARFTP